MAHWKTDVARARWRADLFEYAAAALRSVGFTQEADGKDAKAHNAREFADACERFEVLRESEKGSAAYDAAREAFLEIRSARRAAGANEPAVKTINNFSEPSDDELLGVQS
jgi:hypothetical protein